MSAELSARRIAAAAVLADFRAEVARSPLSQPPAGSWAYRLAIVLDDLMEITGPRDEAGSLARRPLTEYRPFVQHAFADAVRWQKQILAEPCAACRRLRGLPGRLCDRHRNAADQIAVYERVFAALGLADDDAR